MRRVGKREVNTNAIARISRFVLGIPELEASPGIERKKTKRAPVREPVGHWRNRWEVPKKYEALAREQGALPLGDGTWLGYRRFATEKEAEEHARKYVAYNLTNFGIRYLGTEFFP